MRSERPQVFLKKLERFCELRGLSVPEVIDQLTAKGHSKVAISDTLSQTSVDHAVIASISDLLVVPNTEFEILQLEPDEEVTYAWIADQPEKKGSYKNALASCKHHTEAGGFDWVLSGKEEHTSQFFSYVYNYGDAPVNIVWGSDRCLKLAQGDSAVIKPFIPVSFSAVRARLLVCKVAGCVNNSVMHECSLFVDEGLQRMNSDTTQWW